MLLLLLLLLLLQLLLLLLQLLLLLLQLLQQQLLHFRCLIVYVEAKVAIPSLTTTMVGGPLSVMHAGGPQGALTGPPRCLLW